MTASPLTDQRRTRTHSLDLSGRLAYGGDYNPEQWDEATIEHDIELMKKAGVTMVTLGVFSWALLEPSRGHYDLDWIVRLVDRLWEAGIAVDMATGTASPPAWLGREEPSTCAVTADGVRLAWGSRQHYCPTSPILRQAMADLAGALAGRLAQHPGVVMWHINNEYGCHVAECFCDQCAQAFRDWLFERYGSLEAINHAWGTAFWSQVLHSRDDIIPPRRTATFPSPGRETDWKRFCSDALRGCYEAEEAVVREAIHAAGRHVPVTTNFMNLFEPINYADWEQCCDLITNDCYPDPADPRACHMIAFNGDLMRGLGQGRPWLLMEQAPSQVQWRTRNAIKRPGEFLLGSLAHVARGADGICQFQWRQSVAGAETFHSGMVPHLGEDSAIFREVVRTGEVLAGLSDVVGQRVHADVAFVVDWDSMWISSSAIGPDSAGGHVLAPQRSTVARSLSRWHGTAYENRLSTEIVPARTSVDSPSQAKVLVLAELAQVSADVIARAEQVCRDGGCVVVTSRTGVFTELGHAVQGGYASALSHLTGIRVGAQVPILATAHEPWSDEELPDASVSPIAGAVTPTWGSEDCPLLPEGPLARAAQGEPLLARAWSEEILVDADDVVVLARYATGPLQSQPAITARAVEGGHVIYVGVDCDERTRSCVMRLAAAYAGVSQVLSGQEIPDGVEVTRRGDHLFILNYSDVMRELSGIEGWDAVSQTAVTGHLILAPRSAAVVRVSLPQGAGN